MEFVTVALRRQDLAALRIMVRVLTVQRLMEAITSLRPKPQGECSDMAMLAELLRFQDAHRTYDHHLLTALETSFLQGLDEVPVPMTPETLKFYQTITESSWEIGTTITGAVWARMVESCQKSQGDIHRRLLADDKPQDANVSVNMKPAGGKN